MKKGTHCLRKVQECVPFLRKIFTSTNRNRKNIHTFFQKCNISNRVTFFILDIHWLPVAKVVKIIFYEERKVIR